MKAALQHLVELLQKELSTADRKGDLEFISDTASFVIDQSGTIILRVGISRSQIFNNIDEFILYAIKQEEVAPEKRDLL